ncbi:T9SS type A sorting domain-containing protein [Saprospiraceae bacterium]|nr:T9SS type A sorting domain-containing protein [Saprospiraceae bacterium]
MKNILIFLILITFSKSSFAQINLGFVALDDITECTGSDSDQNLDFIDWRIQQSSQILTAATSNCGGSLMISDDYSPINWIMTSSCESEVTVTWQMSDDCGSTPVTTAATFIIEDTQPPVTSATDMTIQVNCLTDIDNIPVIDIEDECEGTLNISPTIDDSGVICDSEGVVIFQYEIGDACGNISSDSPVTITIEIDQDPADELMWLDPDDNLPTNIELILNQVECMNDFSFPDCSMWSEDPTDPNSETWPFPLIEGVHYQSPCGNAVFTSTHTPCPIFPGGGDFTVTYTVEDGCGTPLMHEFDIEVTCANCSNSNGIFCPICEEARPDGCFTCDVNELLDGFESCNPPYQGDVQGPPQPSPLCNGQGVPNNMSWFAFVVGSPTISVEVCPTECIASQGSIGIQAGIYEECQGECIAGDGACPNTLRCINFSLGDLNVGQEYFLFVDGCNGAECTYDITVEGQDAYVLDDIVGVTVDSECSSTLDGGFCSGQTISFNVNHDGATGNFGPSGGPYDLTADLCFEWSFTPELNGVTNETYSQLEFDGPTPDFVLPIVDEETMITVCIEDVFGPCDDPCDVADCISGDCCVTITVLPPAECFDSDSCIITNLVVETTPCSADSIYNLNFEFDFNSPNCNGFTATSNGVILENFAYGQDNYNLGPFNCGDIEELLITDNINNCSAIVAVPQADCCIGSTCIITELAAETLPCNSAGLYFVDFTFLVENPGPDGFIASGNGSEFGSFDYGESSYRLGPFENCDDITELIITDSSFSLCRSVITVDSPDCCEGADICSFTELIAETLPCSADSVYFVDFNFNIANPGNSGFTAQGNGTVFRTFDYGESLYRIGPFDSCDDINELVLIDNDDNVCNISIGINPPDCCPEIEECTIEDLVILNYNITSDSFLQISFDFTPIGTTALGFDLFINGTFNSFNNYMDVPYEITFDQINPTGSITVEVCDNDNADCCSSVVFDKEDLDLCTFQNLSIIQTECVDENYFYNINFLYPSDQDTTQFVLSGNGNNYGTFRLEDLPVTIGSFNIDDIINELSINIIDQVDCNTSVQLDPMCDIIDSNDDILSNNIEVKLIRDMISVVSEIDSESVCYIYNIQGQLSYQSSFNDKLLVPTSNYVAGIYIIHIRNELGYLTTKLFLN